MHDDVPRRQSYSAEALVALPRRTESTVSLRPPHLCVEHISTHSTTQRRRGERRGTRRKKPGTPHPVNHDHPARELDAPFWLFLIRPPRKTLVSHGQASCWTPNCLSRPSCAVHGPPVSQAPEPEPRAPKPSLPSATAWAIYIAGVPKDGG